MSNHDFTHDLIASCLALGGPSQEDRITLARVAAKTGMACLSEGDFGMAEIFFREAVEHAKAARGK